MLRPSASPITLATGSLVAVSLLTVGCGTRTGLLESDRSFESADAAADVVAPDAGIDAMPDGMPDAVLDVTPDGWLDAGSGVCPMVWGACQPVGAPLLLSGDDLGQSPDLTWTGEHFLAVYDSFGGNDVAAVDAQGTLMWREDVGGIQEPRIAYHRGLQVGLVVADSGVRWLDGAGKPVGAFEYTTLTGSQLKGDVSPIESGFLLLSGANAYSQPPALYAAVLPNQPDEVIWSLIAEGAPRASAEHALGANGLVQWAASSVWFEPIAELYDVNGAGEMQASAELGPMLPNNGEGYVVGLASHEGRRFALYEGAPGEVPVWSMWLLHLDSGASHRIDLSHNGSTGHILSMADALVVASGAIHPTSRVSVGRYDPAFGTVEPEVVLSAESNIAHSARLTNWDRGYAVVWSEGTGDTDGLSAKMQIFDCCVVL